MEAKDIPNDGDGLSLDLERLSKALAEPFVEVPPGLSREELRRFIQAHADADGSSGSV